MIDPWAGYNQGMQNLGNTFASLRQEDQQRQAFALEQKRQEMLNRALKLKTDEAEREEQMRVGLKDYVASQQPTAQFVPDAQQSPIPQLGGIPGQQTPAGFQMPQAEQPQSVFNTPGQIQQGPQPNLERSMLEYYRQTDPLKAQEFGNQLVSKFRALVEVDPAGAVQWYSGIAGINLQYAGTQGNYIITKTDDGKIIATDKSNPLKSQIVYEGQSRGDIQGELIDKRFEQQKELLNLRGNQQMSMLNQRLAAKGSGGGTGGRSGGSGRSSGGDNGKPMPATALRLQKDELDAIGIASGIKADLEGIQQQVESGDLKLGLAENLAAKARNRVGLSDKSSRNFATFQATLEKLRNDSLRLNKGVQTEGDAQRAWNEIMDNVNDANLVKKRLAEVQVINERAVNLRKNNIDVIRANYGKEPLDTTSFERTKGATNIEGKKGAKVRSIGPATSFLKGAKSRDEAKSRIKRLAEKGWTREELTQAAKAAGLE